MEAAEAPIDNPRLEIVAQELAKGKSPVEASKEAGYPPGSSFDSNARKRAQDHRVKARIQYLQRISGITAAVDSAYIQRKLVAIIDVPLVDDQVRVGDQLKAMDMILKMLPDGYAPEKVDARAAVASMNVEVTDEHRLRALMALLARQKTEAA